MSGERRVKSPKAIHRKPPCKCLHANKGRTRRQHSDRCLFDIPSPLAAWRSDDIIRPPKPVDDEMRLAGDHTQVDTPVPIPNTAVKRLGPMIV